MPKDLQIDPLSRRNRTTLRELSNIRRHNDIYYSELESHGGRPQTQSLNAVDMNTAMDAMETCFLALNLDASEHAEGGESVGSRRSNPDTELDDMTGVQQNLSPARSRAQPITWPTPRPAEACPTIPEPSLCNAQVPASRGLTLEKELKDNKLFQRRILALERRERILKSQIKMQKRVVTSLASEAEGARRLLVIAEEHFRKFEHTIEKLKDENRSLSSLWLRENRAVKDLLEFVASPNDPSVAYISSSSRARLATFYSEVQ